MNKIIRFGTCEDGNIFAKITFNNGNLSISGVIGPKRGGDCTGSCGQFIMSFKEYDKRGHMQLKDIDPATGWNKATIKKFLDIWDKWHLNDMKAGCEHQTGAKWTHKDVNIYHYHLTSKTLTIKSRAEESARQALINGETFTPTPEQTHLASLPYSIKSWEKTTPDGYEPAKETTYSRSVETKSTGWLNENEHPEGFLSKACPVCGYKYGTAWKKQEVPSDVIEFLQSLPDTDITPAWV